MRGSVSPKRVTMTVSLHCAARGGLQDEAKRWAYGFVLGGDRWLHAGGAARDGGGDPAKRSNGAAVGTPAGVSQRLGEQQQHQRNPCLRRGGLILLPHRRLAGAGKLCGRGRLLRAASSTGIALESLATMTARNRDTVMCNSAVSRLVCACVLCGLVCASYAEEQAHPVTSSGTDTNVASSTAYPWTLRA